MTLVPRVPTHIVPDEGVAQGISPRDLVLPSWKLVQAMTRGKAEKGLVEGRFYCAQMEEQREKLRFAILFIRGTRTLWGDPGQPPLCASDDRVMPRPGMKYTHPCQQCPERLDEPWAVHGDERRKRCLPTYAILVYDLDGQYPAVLRLDGFAASKFRAYLTTLLLKTGGRPYSREVIVSSAQTTNRLGTFWYPVFTIGEAIPEEVLQPILGLSKTLRETVTAVEESEIEQDL